MGDVFKTLNLSDDNGIFMEYTEMIDLYNALKFRTMLFSIQKILCFNLGVAFIKSVSMYFFQNPFLHFYLFISDWSRNSCTLILVL